MTASSNQGTWFGNDGSQGVPPGYITRRQAAQRLGMSHTSFRRNVEGSQLTPLVHRKQYFFRQADVEALAASEPPPVAKHQDERLPVWDTSLEEDRELWQTSMASAPGVPVHAPATPIDAATYSKVYRHLERGHGPAACVRDLCLEPSSVDYIYHEWCRQRTVQAISLEASRLFKKIRRKYVRDDRMTTEEAMDTVLRRLDTLEHETMLLRFQLYLVEERLTKGWFVADYGTLDVRAKLLEHQLDAQGSEHVMDGLEEEAEDYSEEMARSLVNQPKP